ncbi:uncharacterized protein ACO6RY_03348 [Pungitius sinensis]
MDHNEGHSSRRPTVPPLSTRTLRHPSFVPVYVAAAFAHHRTDRRNPTLPVITPAELFYTDPTMSRGRRVPIVHAELKVLDCFRLNTPPPVMSAFPAPPSRPDPFRSGAHPTRDLGSLSLRVNTAGPRRVVVVQLTQEEDQAVTNLLKLHHQEEEEPLRSGEALAGAFGPLCSEVPRAGEAGWLQRGEFWSVLELEAADTLVSGFGPAQREQI